MFAASLFSGGKESIHAISMVGKQGVEVKHLIHQIPTFDSPHAHNVEALQTLARSMNKHLTVVDLHKGEHELVELLKNLNVDALVAGDINVPQHVTWLENICSQVGIVLLEPLFGKNTQILFEEMFNDPRFKATIIGVNTKYLSNEWLGFTISNETAQEFRLKTPQIDPLGENGEFHTIVVESPLYSNRFKIEIVERITEKEMTSLRVTLTERNR